MPITRDPIPRINGNDGKPLVASSDATRITFGDPGWVNVRNRGVSGDGTDEAAAIQDVLDESLFVLFPESASTYSIGTSLTLRHNHHLRGIGRTHTAGSNRKPQIAARSGFNAPLINAPTQLYEVSIESLMFSGRNASGSKGIYAALAERWHIEHCTFDTFGDQAIDIDGGAGGVFRHLFIDNALLITTGRTDYVGAMDIGAQDVYMDAIEAGAPSSGIGSGYRAAIVLRGTNGVMHGCIGQLSEVGIVILNELNKLTSNRADLNYGHGFVFSGANNNQVCNNESFRNGRATTNTYDGFFVTSVSRGNTFDANLANNSGVDTVVMRYGFNDTTTPSTDIDRNYYLGNRSRNLGTGRYSANTLTYHAVSDHEGLDFRVRSGKLLAAGGLGVGNSAAATTPGTVTKKIEVFDATGASLGFVAIYNAIT